MAAAIRNMTPADLPAIETIEQRVFTEPWDMGSYAACLRSGCYARVAEDAGTVAGGCPGISGEGNRDRASR